jgi:hypothetical protein
MGRMKNDNLCFWAKECINQYEIFTKHQEILYDVECHNTNKVVTDENCIQSVICAGELLIPSRFEINEKNAIFNFSSGTFMAEKSSSDFGEEKSVIISNFAAQGICIEFTEDISSFILPTLFDLKTMKQLDSTGIIDIYKFDNPDEPRQFLHSNLDVSKLELRLNMEKIRVEKYKNSKNPNPKYLIEDQEKLDKMSRQLEDINLFRIECRSKIIQLKPPIEVELIRIPHEPIDEPPLIEPIELVERSPRRTSRLINSPRGGTRKRYF